MMRSQKAKIPNYQKTKEGIINITVVLEEECVSTLKVLPK